MKIYDVSMTIHKDIQVYKNKPEKKPVIEVIADFLDSGVHETALSMNLHTGTHMDFPLHMIPGDKTSDSLDLNRLIREVKVFDMTHVKTGITSGDLERLEIKPNDFVLFKTQNSFEDTFNFEFIYLQISGATYLASKGISGVGIDALGIERDQADHPTHRMLFDHDIVIVEGLRLKEVPSGSYMMYALPIKVAGSDALPLAVILVGE